MQAQEAPLREMQRLLGETWRYQQLMDLSTGSFPARPGAPSEPQPPEPPVRFDGLGPREPPPICSDLLEVRNLQGGSLHGGGPSTSGLSSAGSTPLGGASDAASAEYAFLGRLVATLPGGEARSGFYSGPSPPQAVVECNFWQLRGGTGGGGSVGSGGRPPTPQPAAGDGGGGGAGRGAAPPSFAHYPDPGPHPSEALQPAVTTAVGAGGLLLDGFSPNGIWPDSLGLCADGLSADLDAYLGAEWKGLGEDFADGEELPPWPHEM